MLRKPKIEELITTNPNVDRSKLEEVLKVLDALKKAGIRGREYSLEQPFSGKLSTRSETRVVISKSK